VEAIQEGATKAEEARAGTLAKVVEAMEVVAAEAVVDTTITEEATAEVVDHTKAI
jgi:hypothetical protein